MAVSRRSASRHADRARQRVLHPLQGAAQQLHLLPAGRWAGRARSRRRPWPTPRASAPRSARRNGATALAPIRKSSRQAASDRQAHRPEVATLDLPQPRLGDRQAQDAAVGQPAARRRASAAARSASSRRDCPMPVARRPAAPPRDSRGSPSRARRPAAGRCRREPGRPPRCRSSRHSSCRAARAQKRVARLGRVAPRARSSARCSSSRGTARTTRSSTARRERRVGDQHEEHDRRAPRGSRRGR